MGNQNRVTSSVSRTKEHKPAETSLYQQESLSNSTDQAAGREGSMLVSSPESQVKARTKQAYKQLFTSVESALLPVSKLSKFRAIPKLSSAYALRIPKKQFRLKNKERESRKQRKERERCQRGDKAGLDVRKERPAERSVEERMKELEEVCVLGRGGFGKVIKARKLLNNIAERSRYLADNDAIEEICVNDFCNESERYEFVAVKKCLSTAQIKSEARILAKLTSDNSAITETSLTAPTTKTAASGRVFIVKLLDAFEVGARFSAKQYQPVHHRSKSRRSMPLSSFRHSLAKKRHQRFDGSEGDAEFWQVMEVCEAGDLVHVLRFINRPLSLIELKLITVQILKALAYIHARGIVHRDVKALNVLLNSKGIVKLCDFGAAIDLNDATSPLGATECELVSDLWMAPEIFTNDSRSLNSTAQVGKRSTVDIWSFGVTMIELYKQKPPFSELNGSLAWGLISALPECSRRSQLSQLGLTELTAEEPFDAETGCTSEAPHSIDSQVELERFIAKSLVTDPQSRPSSLELLNDQFLAQEAQYLDDLLEKCHDNKIGPVELLSQLAMTAIRNRDLEC